MATPLGLIDVYRRFTNLHQENPGFAPSRFAGRREDAARTMDEHDAQVDLYDARHPSAPENGVTRTAPTRQGSVLPQEDRLSLLVCPKDGSAMHEIVRDGVFIDLCPHGHGVWLDRGELDKLLECVSLTDDARITDRTRPNLRKLFN